MRALVRQQMKGAANLRHAPGVHHGHAVAVHDGVQAVRNGDHGAVCKLVADGLLNQRVRVVVDIGRGLV